MVWLDQARALRAQYDNQPFQEFKFLLRSRQWGAAHDLFLTKLAPAWVLADKEELLVNALGSLSPHARETGGWETGGGLYLRFLELTSLFKDMINGTQSMSLGFE